MIGATGNGEAAKVLGHVRIEGGLFVSSLKPEEPAGDGADNSAVLRRLVGPDDFHTNLVAILGWMGNRSGLESLRIDKADPAFIDANALVYEHLMDGPGAVVAEWLGDERVKDLVVIGGAYVPLVLAARAELKAKRARPVQQPEDKDDVQ